MQVAEESEWRRTEQVPEKMKLFSPYREAWGEVRRRKETGIHWALDVCSHRPPDLTNGSWVSGLGHLTMSCLLLLLIFWFLWIQIWVSMYIFLDGPKSRGAKKARGRGSFWVGESRKNGRECECCLSKRVGACGYHSNHRMQARSQFHVYVYWTYYYLPSTLYFKKQCSCSLIVPTPVFLPWESQWRGGLVGCRLWGCTESDTTEAT